MTSTTTPSTTTTPLLLYESPTSPFVHKVKIALREKSLPFTKKVPEDLMASVNPSTGRPVAHTNSPSPLRSTNPRLEVPVFMDGDFSIFDSTIILEYIEDKWPSPPLRPSDPQQRARARMIEEICDTEYEAINWGFGEVRLFGRAEGALADEMERQARHHVSMVQGWLTEKLGQNEYFNGEIFGWADVCVAPIVNRSVTFGMGPEDGSPLAMWLERAKGRESVRVTFEEYEASLGAMKALVPLVASGEKKREYRSHRLEWMVKAGGLEIVREGIEKGNIRFTWPNNV